MSSIQQYSESRFSGHLRPLRRRRGRAVTLFEVLIVVAILALVSGSVAVFALPRFRDAQKDTAKTDCRTIQDAVHQWQLVSNETSCPTVSQLLEDKILKKGTNTNDPWGQPYTITCTGEEDVIVTSSGPDKKKGSTDDISIGGDAAAAADEG